MKVIFVFLTSPKKRTKKWKNLTWHYCDTYIKSNLFRSFFLKNLQHHKLLSKLTDLYIVQNFANYQTTSQINNCLPKEFCNRGRGLSATEPASHSSITNFLMPTYLNYLASTQLHTIWPSTLCALILFIDPKLNFQPNWTLSGELLFR